MLLSLEVPNWRIRFFIENSFFKNQVLRLRSNDVGAASKSFDCCFVLFTSNISYDVTKSQKQFFLKLHCQKTNEILDKILPYEARAQFCQIFRSFFGQWSFKKKCFWDLLTFSWKPLRALHQMVIFSWMDKSGSKFKLKI